jgi:hypothetical protein
VNFLVNYQALSQAGVNVRPAVMTSFSSIENIRVLKERLKAIDDSFEDDPVSTTMVSIFCHREGLVNRPY